MIFCRFFCLTSQCLTYSKSKGEAPLCTIPSNEMLAVERVDESAFGMKFVSVLIKVWLSWIVCLLDVPADSTRKNIIYASQKQCGGTGMVHNHTTIRHIINMMTISG